MKYLKTVLAVAASALISSTALADVKVGIIQPLTGPASALGIPYQNQAKFFPTTIGGEKVSYFFLDDATDPLKGASNARRLITEENIDILLGSAVTSVAASANDVATEAGVTHLAVAPVVVPAGKDKWLFRLAQSYSVMGHAIVDHMKKNGVKKIGFLGYTDAYGEQWLKEITPQLARAGISLVVTERFARTDSSVSPQALKLIAAQPDAIFIVASGSGAAMPHVAVVERGYKGKIYQTHAAGTQDLIRVGGKAVEGAYLVSSPAVVAEQLPDAHPSKKVGLDFVQKYEAAYGPSTRNVFASHAYDAGLVLSKVIPVALKKAKPGTPEFRSAIRDAMENMGLTIFSGGVMNWTKDDHWGYTNETGVMLRVVDGKFKVEQ